MLDETKKSILKALDKIDNENMLISSIVRVKEQTDKIRNLLEAFLCEKCGDLEYNCRVEEPEDRICLECQINMVGGE